jgi:putative tricarboxylic transport membrane protein
VAANAALITRIGFILACTLCFMLAVRGLRLSEGKGSGGARQVVLDFVTGFLIAAPAFWLFTKVLAINLPGLTGTGWI